MKLLKFDKHVMVFGYLVILFSLGLSATASEETLSKHKEDVDAHHVVQRAEDGQVNYMTPYHIGTVALQKRLDMINDANETIDIEYFMYAPDQVGRLLTQALVKAAKRGVTVRLLIDSFDSVMKMDHNYAKLLSDRGIEVKYYASPFSQFRSHRKQILIDGKTEFAQSITGGRNIGNEYFDFENRFHFMDRDVHVIGPIVKAMQATFENFWYSENSYTPNTTSIMSFISDIVIKAKSLDEFLEESEEDRQMLNRLAKIADPIIADKISYQCEETVFAADRRIDGLKKEIGASMGVLESVLNDGKRPSGDYQMEDRIVTKVIRERILAPREDKFVLLSSPYFFEGFNNTETLQNLIKQKRKITMYTNSLGSTDGAFLMSPFYNKHAPLFLENNIDLRVHAGVWFEQNSEPMNEKIKEGVWGTHSKTHIYGDDEVMIGTFNIDGRSGYFNAEMVLFCKGNKDFVKNVRDDIEQRMENGYKVIFSKDKELEAVDSAGNKVNVYGENSDKAKSLSDIATPLMLLLEIGV